MPRDRPGGRQNGDRRLEIGRRHGGPYRTARELGIETNIAELEAFGFTVIPPERTGAPKILRRACSTRCSTWRARKNELAVELNKHSNPKPDRRRFFHLLQRDPVFIDATINPAVRTMAAYMMARATACSAWSRSIRKAQHARRTCIAIASVCPSPLPAYSTVCNVSWVLTPYREETGTFGMVPGSHRLCRHPTQFEQQPQFIGGMLENDNIMQYRGRTWLTRGVHRQHLALHLPENRRRRGARTSPGGVLPQLHGAGGRLYGCARQRA